MNKGARALQERSESCVVPRADTITESLMSPLDKKKRKIKKTRSHAEMFKRKNECALQKIYRRCAA